MLNLVTHASKDKKTQMPVWPTLAIDFNKVSGGPLRTGKQCRERWVNSLRPGVKKGAWTREEEQKIELLHDTFGPKWSCIAKLLSSSRSDNDVKNKWHSLRAKKAATEACQKEMDSLHKTAEAAWERQSPLP